MKLDVGQQATKHKNDVARPNLVGYELDSERYNMYIITFCSSITLVCTNQVMQLHGCNKLCKSSLLELCGIGL
jgi:hypothetical protein